MTIIVRDKFLAETRYFSDQTEVYQEAQELVEEALNNGRESAENQDYEVIINR